MMENLSNGMSLPKRLITVSKAIITSERSNPLNKFTITISTPAYQSINFFLVFF